MFSEEGRARREGRGVLALLAALCLFVSIVGGYVVYVGFVKHNLTPLQRVYLPRYYHSAWRSLLPFNLNSPYPVLSRTTTDPKTKKDKISRCLEFEVDPVLNDDGMVSRTSQGYPDFRLKPEYATQMKPFIWDKVVAQDKGMHDWFRDYIYDGKEAYELFYPSLATALFIFIPGMGGASIFQRRRVKRVLKGRVVRGTRELTPGQYARSHAHDDGIGLEVFLPEKGD